MSWCNFFVKMFHSSTKNIRVYFLPLSAQIYPLRLFLTHFLYLTFIAWLCLLVRSPAMGTRGGGGSQISANPPPPPNWILFLEKSKFRKEESTLNTGTKKLFYFKFNSVLNTKSFKPNMLVLRNRYRFVLGRRCLRILAGKLIIVTEVSCGFPQFLQPRCYLRPLLLPSKPFSIHHTTQHCMV
jgi:hypothetical protein